MFLRSPDQGAFHKSSSRKGMFQLGLLEDLASGLLVRSLCSSHEWATQEILPSGFEMIVAEDCLG